MRKKKIMTLIVLLVLVSGIYFAFPIASHYYWSIRGFLEPDMIETGRERYRKMPSEYLLKKLDSFSSYNVQVALDVLVEREEKEAVPRIIRFLESGDKYLRKLAIRSLGEIGDERAIKPLLTVVSGGYLDITHNVRETPDNILALQSLARLGYEGVYEQAVYLATLDPQEDPYGYRAYGATMLEYYGGLESIAILSRIEKEDPDKWMRDKASNIIVRIE